MRPCGPCCRPATGCPNHSCERRFPRCARCRPDRARPNRPIMRARPATAARSSQNRSTSSSRPKKPRWRNPRSGAQSSAAISRSVTLKPWIGTPIGGFRVWPGSLAGAGHPPIERCMLAADRAHKMAICFRGAEHRSISIAATSSPQTPVRLGFLRDWGSLPVLSGPAKSRTECAPIRNRFRHTVRGGSANLREKAQQNKTAYTGQFSGTGSRFSCTR